MSTDTAAPGLTDAEQALLDTVPVPEGADLVARDVDYAHGDTALRGYRVADVAAGDKRPGVLVVHDWYGLRGYAKARATMLARLGYVAFAVDVYGAGRTFADADAAAAEAGRYYAEPALLRDRLAVAYDLLAADPQVDPARISIIGYCFGGTAALEFARAGRPLRLTASFHGGLTAHVPPDVGRVTGAVYIATGGADPVVLDADVIAFQDELRTNPALEWRVDVFSGAPHAFTLPGTPAYRERADRLSWRAFLDQLALADG